MSIHVALLCHFWPLWPLSRSFRERSNQKLPTRECVSKRSLFQPLLLESIIARGKLVSLDVSNKRDDGNNNNETTTTIALVLLSQIPSLVIFKRLCVSRTLWSYSSPVTPFNVATKNAKKVNNNDARITPFISKLWFSFF